MLQQENDIKKDFLEFDDVNVVFNRDHQNEVVALNSCSFKIPKGSLVFILGHNGSGKSTLLRSICTGSATSGDIRLDSQNIIGIPQYRLARKIVYVAQDLAKALIWDMTVEENFSLAMLRSGKAKFIYNFTPFRRKKIRDVLVQLGMGLEDRLKHIVGDLSGGQRQALALAMYVLTNSPSLLLLDEPTAATDIEVTKKIESIILNQVRSRGLTTLWVTHSIEQALKHADVLITLSNASIDHIYNKSELIDMTKEDFIEVFSK